MTPPSRRAIINTLTLGAAAMALRSDDLTSLFTAQPATPSESVRFRQGIIQTWDPQNCANTVLSGGVLMTNLPILNTSESLILKPGDVVGILVVGSTWAILGRLTIPNTPQAATALTMLSSRIYSENAAGFTTNSTSFVLDEPTIENILVSAAGKIIVIASCGFDPVNYVNSSGGGIMSVDLSGATSITGSDSNGPRAWHTDSNGTDNISFRHSLAYEITDLNPGIHTIRAKFRSLNGAVNCTFGDANITVIAL